MNFLLCPFSDTKLTQTLDFYLGTQPDSHCESVLPIALSQRVGDAVDRELRCTERNLRPTASRESRGGPGQDDPRSRTADHSRDQALEQENCGRDVGVDHFEHFDIGLICERIIGSEGIPFPNSDVADQGIYTTDKLLIDRIRCRNRIGQVGFDPLGDVEPVRTPTRYAENFVAIAPQTLDQSTTKTSARTDNNRPRHNYTLRRSLIPS